jgi:hypothetical protein
MKEALKLALEALQGFIPYLPLKDKEQCEKYDKAITAIKEALAQPAQEPVAWGYRICEFCGCHTNAKARACCDAGRDADKALAQPAQEPDWVWACNECGSPEFTSILSEADLEHLACAGCGCDEFHKEAKLKGKTK